MFSITGKNLTVFILFFSCIIFAPRIFGQEGTQNRFFPREVSKKHLYPAADISIKPDDKRTIFKEFTDSPEKFIEKEFFYEDLTEIAGNFEDEQKADNRSELDRAPQTVSGFEYKFREINKKRPGISFEDTADENRIPLFPPFDPSDKSRRIQLSDEPNNLKSEGFDWNSAIKQSLIFLGVQHGYAMTQPKTRRALKGKFFDDYIKSVKSLKGWGDGGRFFTNYIAHPMQGAFTGFIYVQNDSKAKKQQFGASGDYWRGRLKAMAWSAAWSTQFEIGPISQASIGNVGLSGKQTWVDIVVTPTIGTAMLVAEDAADRFIVKAIERRTDNFYIKIFSRMLFSPTRVFANMLRFKVPWHRDRPPAF